MRRLIFDTLEQARAISPYFIAEAGLGIWLGTDDEVLLAAGHVIELERDALHVPSLTRAGAPVALAVRAEAIGLAERIGLRDRHVARGYWTLSGTGQLQEEAVIIAYSAAAIEAARLMGLAEWLLIAADQDAVAFEVRGRVRHVERGST